MTSQIQISNVNLKNILALYARDTPLKNLILGDTCHPLSGYIDERSFKEIKTVSSLLEVGYDFPCLVDFHAKIGATQVRLQIEPNGYTSFIVSGLAKDISKIRNALIEKNAVHEDLYRYEIIW